MEDKLRNYIESLFATAPASRRAVELKEEILQNLIDKYHDLCAEGKSEEAAYNIAVAGVGDISELINELERSESSAVENNAVLERNRQRSALLTAIAVMLYILCVVPCIITPNGVLGPVLMFVMIAVATGLLIFNNMTKTRYTKKDDNIVEDFKEWKQGESNKKHAYRAVSSSIWALTVIAYFLVSFMTGAWYITWVIFPLGGAINGIVRAIFDLTK